MKKRKEKKYIRFVKKILRNLKNLRIRKYSSKFSKKAYNNHIHIVLLALRQIMDKSYRAFTDIIDVYTEVLIFLGINKAPHFTTLQKATKRFRVAFLEKLIGGFIFLTMAINVRTGIDSTGFC